MARKTRVHYEGALYHVICKGNNGDEIFKTKEDKKKYIDTIMRYKERYDFRLYSYCIMSNHVHMVIEVGRVPLSKIMQGIQQVFTVHYNKEHSRTGHVFEQRYKAILCDSDKYLLPLIKYVHQNPIRNQLKEGFNYEWSSYKSYLNYNSDFVDIKFPLSFYGNKTRVQIKNYLKDMNIQDEDLKLFESERLSGDIDKSNSIKEIKEEKLEPQKLIKVICDFNKMRFEDIIEKTRRAKFVKVRKMIIFMLKKYTDISNKEIAEILKLSGPTISNVLADDDFKRNNQKQMEEIVKIIKG